MFLRGANFFLGRSQLLWDSVVYNDYFPTFWEKKYKDIFENIDCMTTM